MTAPAGGGDFGGNDLSSDAIFDCAVDADDAVGELAGAVGKAAADELWVIHHVISR